MSSAAAVQEMPKTDSNIKLEITRVIKAPRAKVFDAWIRPETIRQWFGTAKTTTLQPETNPVIDGRYKIEMQGICPDAEASRPHESVNHKTGVTGTYTKVSPYDLLQFTWAAQWAPDEISLVTLHFRDVDGGTELKLIHDRFSSEASRDGHRTGWTEAMDKMVALLEA
jgi:uncharacterized protein YndB with AHSA1/START domain